MEEKIGVDVLLSSDYAAGQAVDGAGVQGGWLRR